MRAKITDMYLAVDARNNVVSLGIWDNESWLQVVHLSPDRTSDEYALLFRSIVSQSSKDKIESACIASVVPILTPRLAQAIEAVFGIEALLVGPGIKTGLKIRTDNPGELGADLVCTALAARKRADGACIVVDCGAAITFSAINAQGEFLGVAIAPGLETASKALRSATAQLPEVRLIAPKTVIGKNTAHAMQAGLVCGFRGLVSDLLHRMQEELGGTAKIIVCGEAYGQTLLASLGHTAYVPELVLEGIIMILKSNGIVPEKKTGL